METKPMKCLWCKTSIDGLINIARENEPPKIFQACDRDCAKGLIALKKIYEEILYCGRIEFIEPEFCESLPIEENEIDEELPEFKFVEEEVRLTPVEEILPEFTFKM
jgi:hypothetical protein